MLTDGPESSSFPLKDHAEACTPAGDHAAVTAHADCELMQVLVCLASTGAAHTIHAAHTCTGPAGKNTACMRTLYPEITDKSTVTPNVRLKPFLLGPETNCFVKIL